MMTKILLITNKWDFTTDFVVRRLKEAEADFYRLNTEEIGKSCFATFDFDNKQFHLYDKELKQWYDLHEFTSVYFRRPELPNIDMKDLSQEEQFFIRAEHHQFLEGLYKILDKSYWISPIDSIKRAENKIYQLLLAKEIGFDIPHSLITNRVSDFNGFRDRITNECVIKPIRSGQIGWPETHKVVFTSKLEHVPVDAEIKICPSFLQERIEKECDIRFTIVGRNTFAVAIDSQTNPETQTDWRRGENLLPHKLIELPEQIVEKCFSMLSALNLQYGAFDFVLDKEGNYYFLEVNPNGQWAWIECQTGCNISGAIAKQLIEGKYEKYN